MSLKKSLHASHSTKNTVYTNVIFCRQADSLLSSVLLDLEERKQNSVLSTDSQFEFVEGTTSL